MPIFTPSWQRTSLCQELGLLERNHNYHTNRFRSIDFLRWRFTLWGNWPRSSWLCLFIPLKADPTEWRPWSAQALESAFQITLHLGDPRAGQNVLFLVLDNLSNRQSLGRSWNQVLDEIKATLVYRDRQAMNNLMHDNVSHANMKWDASSPVKQY